MFSDTSLNKLAQITVNHLWKRSSKRFPCEFSVTKMLCESCIFRRRKRNRSLAFETQKCAFLVSAKQGCSLCWALGSSLGVCCWGRWAGPRFRVCDLMPKEEARVWRERGFLHSHFYLSKDDLFSTTSTATLKTPLHRCYSCDGSHSFIQPIKWQPIRSDIINSSAVSVP